MGAAGWVGLDPTLQFIGELAAGIPPQSLDIRLGGLALSGRVRTSRRGGRTTFRFPCPEVGARGVLQISAGGVALLGGNRRWPPDFALDGRSEATARRISGWVRLGWLPAEPVRLVFEDEDGRCHRAKTRNVALTGFRWPFGIDLRRAGLRGSRIRISAELPDGRREPLPDTPLLLARAVGLKGKARLPLPRWRTKKTTVKRLRLAVPRRAPAVDVIIPVYRGRQETLACIDSVLKTTAKRARVIVVDDATDDAALATALDRLAAGGRITLMRNEQNLGFVRSVNRALAIAAGHDVVLLNSDTLVFEDWLQRLRVAAYSAPRVGTVTPLSNDASIASYPRKGGAPIEPAEAAALHKLAAWTHPGVSTEVPVGVGFCVYLRHDCVRQVGELDAAVFGMGYGEETDFCMRARRRGWSHRIAADVYVYHSGGRSFGARRNALQYRSQRLMNLRYPGYDRYIAGFQAQDPLEPVRRRLDQRRLISFEGQFVLLVSLALDGGVERFIDERSRQIRALGLFPLVLKPFKPGNRRQCELRTAALDVPNLRYDIPADLPELISLLRRLRIESIEMSHFLDLDARVIDALRGLGIPYDVVLHDYAWICPRVTLIDGSGRYCQEPEVAVCRVCVRKNGTQIGETISVPALRTRSHTWLAGARQVVAPSADTAMRYSRYFPDVGIQIRPHRTVDAQRTQLAALPQRAAVRVGLIGAIGLHKGYDVLLACARDAVARGLALEFIVVGYTRDDQTLLRTRKVFVTGRYAEREAEQLLRRERPDIVWLPSVWPETWCYALDHAISAGLPVFAFDLGAIAERLRSRSSGVLLPLATPPGEINDRLLAYGADNRVF